MNKFSSNSWRILLVSTPVGALGTGLGGGVELTLKNLAQSLQLKGHSVTVLAPEGSTIPNINIQTVAGEFQSSMQFLNRTGAMCLPNNSVLANLWERARMLQKNYDLILNFAYDWLPFYLTPFFQTPIAHLVSMCSLNDNMDRVICQIAETFPQSLAFHTQSQAETFGLSSARWIGNALDLDSYHYCPHPLNYLAWVGRISPEKALEDAIAAAIATKMELRIYGIIQDREYWDTLNQKFPSTLINYRGFLSTEALQQELRQSKALLMTPRWMEAFGNVVIEALACGVPVVAYQRGGPSEIVLDGKTGFLVEPDSVEALGQAINKIAQIDRQVCRSYAEYAYSLSACGDRLNLWFAELLQDFYSKG
jgi:UDP-glucose:tetrahydrobiopterin glucosyltransferase